MAWSKREIIQRAFSDIGYGLEGFDIPPAKMEDALRILDTLVAEWNVTPMGYPLHDNPADSDLDEDSGIPLSFVNGVVAGLAVRLAPTIGKEASLSIQRAASQGKAAITRIQSKPPARAIDTTMTPAGTGHFIYTPPPLEGETNG